MITVMRWNGPAAEWVSSVTDGVVEWTNRPKSAHAFASEADADACAELIVEAFTCHLDAPAPQIAPLVHPDAQETRSRRDADAKRRGSDEVEAKR